MNNTTNSKSSVYVDLDALNSWSSNMASINESAILDLDSLVSVVKELNDYWTGNIVTGFLNDSEQLIRKAKQYHNQMKDVPNFLIEVAKKMNNQ